MFCFGYALRFPANENLARKVRDYLDEPLSGMIEVGDGLLAIRQARSDSFDLFFDQKKWEAVVEIKEDFYEEVFPFELEGVGVLRSKYFKAGIRNTDIMLAICEHNLRSISTEQSTVLAEGRNYALYKAYGFLKFSFTKK